jgi:hypothetical protein
LQKLALAAGVIAAGFAGWLIVHTTPSHAADHLDSPTLAANPMADINDVYAWMTPDALNVNLAMSVSPNDPGTMAMPNMRHFSPSILYTFHVTSTPGVGMAGMETLVTCRMNSDTDAECWVGTLDYVHGDPSNTAGVASADGKVKLFAGLRSDPFFFNLQGFRDAVSFVEGAGTLATDAAGCPQLTDVIGGMVRNKLTEAAQPAAGAPCATDSKDCFAHLNAKIILVQIDKTLLNQSGKTMLSVWASTNMVGP